MPSLAAKPVGEAVVRYCPVRGRGGSLHSGHPPPLWGGTRGYSPQPLRGLAGLAAVDETGFDASQGLYGRVFVQSKPFQAAILCRSSPNSCSAATA